MPLIMVSQQSQTAWSYVGIPYPTDNVPGAIMPTVPTGADTASFPYDPCTVTAPATPDNWPSLEQANYYYVDKFHGSATDTANTYGYPDKPRLTVPSAAFANGSLYVELHGNNTAYTGAGAAEYTWDTLTIAAQGTTSQPFFIQGVDSPLVGIEVDITGKHVVFDSMYMQPHSSGPLIPHIGIVSAEYITIRNNTIRGTGAAITGGTGQIITIGGTETTPNKFTCIYNNEIFDGGEWNIQHNKDIHMIRPSYWNRYVWIINNTVYHGQGDCIQMGNSTNTSIDKAKPSHYTYIAGNTFYEMFENALDNKNSYHVILSSNTIHGFGNGIGTGTAVIASNNDEGTTTAYHWQINNEIYNTTAGAIRHSGDQVGELTYSIGNWVHDCSEGIMMADHGGSDNNDEWCIHNTITNCTSRAIAFNRGNGDELYIRGNITYDNPTHVENLNGFTSSTLKHHVSYNSDTTATGVNAGDYNTASNNQIDTDPVFTAPGTDDFTLDTGSPAIDAVATVDPIFAAFNDLYGVSIQTDINGTPIPDTNSDIGAYQSI